VNETDQGSVDLSAVRATGDPAVGLRAVLALRRLAERVEAQQVALAREQGWSWQQIGDALGVTRQSIHTKYGKGPR
jgi:Homeodomain-like domain